MKILRCLALVTGVIVALSFLVVPIGFGADDQLSVEEVFLEMLTRKKVLEEIREQWPQYEDMSDDQLAREFYKKAKEDSTIKGQLEQMVQEDKERDEKRMKEEEERIEKERNELAAKWDITNWQSDLEESGRFQGIRCSDGVIVVLDTKQGHLWSYVINGKLGYIGQIVPGEPVEWPK